MLPTVAAENFEMKQKEDERQLPEKNCRLVFAVYTTYMYNVVYTLLCIYNGHKMQSQMTAADVSLTANRHLESF